MKVKQLKVCNIGKIENETVVFEKPLNLFFGEIKSGKTTLAINSIKLLFGGSFSNDLLNHGKSVGSVELLFDNAAIVRKFYKSKTGEVKSYPIEFYRDNRKVSKPVDVIRELINPFLLDQEFLTKKSAIEKERYFIELFNIDTAEIDAELKLKLDDSKELRSTITSYGVVEMTPVEKPDMGALLDHKKIITEENDRISKVWSGESVDEARRVLGHNNEVDKHNTIVDRALVETSGLMKQINDLEFTLSLAKENYKKVTEWLDDSKNNKKKLIEPKKIEKPECESTEEIDEKISNAKVDELRYVQYQAALTKQEEKEYHAGLLAENETLVISLRAMKRNELSKIADKTGIKEFTFDEDGNIRYQNTAMDMLSTSQMMELSSACAGLYPSDIGLELIDKAESLGKSIFEYIDKAKEKNSTIIATIVSDKLAENIPEDVGVFVVEDGKII